MLRSSAAKVALIIIFALALGYYDLPNKLQGVPGTPDIVKSASVHLGLDLQGGSQLDYKIDLKRVPDADKEAIVEGVREVINRRVNTLGVSEPNIYTSQVGNETHLIVELAGIKDLEQAKKVVGKTIQLEFKEKREKPDPQRKVTVRKNAQTALNKITADPDQFLLVAQEESLGKPDQVKFTEEPYVFLSEINDTKISAAISTAAPGKVIARALEGSDGYTVLDGEMKPNEGIFIIKLEEKRDTALLPAEEKSLMVSHLLVAYSGAERAAETVTRTKEEANIRAEDLLKRLKAGASFATLASQNSDEPAAKDSKGKLSAPVKSGGSYDERFTSAALALAKKNELSAVTETPFGFHIIRADDFTQYRYSKLFYSTAPDPWQPTGLTGEHFERAQVEFDRFLQPIVAIKFNDEGAKLFEEITSRNIGKPLAIFVGGNLISSPNVNDKIAGGSAVITGRFSADEANALARDLNTGAIPAPVILSGQYTIGATLGQEALSKSVKAGLIGLILLAFFMVLYYRLPGLIAIIALGLYTALLLFLVKSELPLAVGLLAAIVIFVAIVYKLLKAAREGGWEKFVTFVLACFILFFVTYLISNAITLTLAGIAGVILSIGMAVDANVLIFERLKEEIRAGRPLSSAIDQGFDRAWSSIRDSNFSSLITCAILFYFGSSIIQGFAFNLAAGILVSMFTAITITKTLLNAAMRTRLGEKLWLWGAKPTQTIERKTYRIIERTKLWFGLSGIVLGISLIALILFGLKLGIDFKGGTLIDISFVASVSADEIKTELESFQKKTNTGASASSPAAPIAIESGAKPLDLASSRIVPAGENRFIINTEHMEIGTHDELLTHLKKRFGEITENRFTTIGPVVGASLKKRALLAVIIAMTAIVLYIAFAFRKIPKRVSSFRFGLCAIAALFHDVLIPIGVFAILRFEVDALFITAILTVMGFSVHDTIVVFDRIRENLRYQGGDETFAQVADKSMTQTMARSINTSLTALITLIALMAFGAASIFNFVLVLVIGIAVGTYSSIFIASPLLVLWQKRDAGQ